MPEEPTLTHTEATTAHAEAQMRERIDDLTDEQRAQLSQALFPETHPEQVMVGGKERSTAPLTIQYR